MYRTFAGATLALCATSAYAQDAVMQRDSRWYTDAEAKIQEMAARQPITGRAKNVILLIADGNGVGTNYAIRLFDGQQKGMLGEENVLPYEAFPNVALVKTYNTNAQTPDSAPTASAMNTGVKSKFSTINVSEDAIASDCSTLEGNELTTFAKMMQDAGKSVGVVSTARITHATPAAVYVHTVDRDWENNSLVPEGCDQKDIALQLFDAMQDGMIDVAMGGGRSQFLPTDVLDQEGSAGKRTDGRDLVEESKSFGAQYAWNTESFEQLSTKGSNSPIFGLFAPSHMQYEFDRTDEPSLSQMSETAIRALQNNENGYYLEIESGRVDHANHEGNLFRTLTDGVEFAKTVALVDELTDDEDTLIVVTADHEHAIAFNGYCGRGSPINGLCYKIDDAGEKYVDEAETADDGKPYTVVGFLNGPGAVLVEQAGDTFSGTRPAELTEAETTDPDYIQQALIPFSSETHSGEDVMVFAKGPWAHLFDGVVEQNYLFHVMNHAASQE